MGSSYTQVSVRVCVCVCVCVRIYTYVQFSSSPQVANPSQSVRKIWGTARHEPVDPKDSVSQNTQKSQQWSKVPTDQKRVDSMTPQKPQLSSHGYAQTENSEVDGLISRVLIS